MSLRRHFKVFTALSFLRIKSRDLTWYQWIYPTLVFATFFAGYFLVGQNYFTFEAKQTISSINSLMGILVGFYIAALAAVSSFSNDHLDQRMKGRTPVITFTRQGKRVTERLTRRRFLSILFGYCASLSIFLYGFGVIQTQFARTHVFGSFGECVMMTAGVVAWALYSWALCSLLVVTLLGLHYLVDRMHRA